MTKPIANSGPVAEITDIELANNVRLFLSGNRRGLSQITVFAEQGTTKLSGSVASFFLRQMAISLAMKVAGVRRVVDDLEVDSVVANANQPQSKNGPVLGD